MYAERSQDLGRTVGRNRTLLVSFAALAAVSLFGGFLPDAYWGNGAVHIFLPTYSFFVLGIGVLFPLVADWRRTLRPAIALALALLFITVVVDTVRPGYFSALDSRAAGVAENPNAAAIRLVLLVSVLLTYDRVRGIELGGLGTVGLAAIMTFSRGGLLLFLVLVSVYAIYVYRWRFTQTVRAVALLTVVGVGLVLFFGQVFEGLPLAEAVNPSRLAFFTGGNGLELGGDIRVRLIGQYLGMVNEAPWLGHGSGFSFGPTGGEIQLGPHNMYLRQWVDNGLPGLLAYLGVIGSAGFAFHQRGLRSGVALVIVVAAAGFFSHNLLEDRTLLLLLGILASVSVFRLRGDPKAELPRCQDVAA